MTSFVLQIQKSHGHRQALSKNVTKGSILNKDSRSEYGLQQHDRLATAEIILIIWVFTLLCEEIRQVKIMNRCLPSICTYHSLGTRNRGSIILRKTDIILFDFLEQIGLPSDCSIFCRFRFATFTNQWMLL